MLFRSPVAFATVFLLAGAIRGKVLEIIPCAILLFFLYVAALLYPDWVWKIPTAGFFIPLLLTALCCAPFARLRSEFNWLKLGKLDQVVTALLLITSLVSALSLILWALWTNYLGVASQMIAPLKAAPRWFTLPILVPSFALGNALAEELVFRGIIQDSLEKNFPHKPHLSLMLQASAFAAAHFQAGFPNGKAGYTMTFIYAVVLGWLRRRSGGLLAPYIAHVVADLVIGFTLVLLRS